LFSSARIIRLDLEIDLLSSIKTKRDGQARTFTMP
jgi:hypothetical protein